MAPYRRNAEGGVHLALAELIKDPVHVGAQQAWEGAVKVLVLVAARESAGLRGLDPLLTG